MAAKEVAQTIFSQISTSVKIEVAIATKVAHVNDFEGNPSSGALRLEVTKWRRRKMYFLHISLNEKDTYDIALQKVTKMAEIENLDVKKDVNVDVLNPVIMEMLNR